MAKTPTRTARTPEQQAIYDELNQAWKVAARVIAADLPVHVPASAIRRALACNMREIEPLAQLSQKYRASLGVNHPIPLGGRAPLPPIPDQVYWSAEHGNFYGQGSKRGQGQEFYDRWVSRRDEFPTSRHEDDHGADEYAGHDRGCRARALGAQGECNCPAGAEADA